MILAMGPHSHYFGSFFLLPREVFLNQDAIRVHPGCCSTGPRLPWISAMSCHGAGGPAASTTSTNSALGPICTMLFNAMVIELSIAMHDCD